MGVVDAILSSEYAPAVAMYVVKRDGRHEEVRFDKITARIKKLVSPGPRAAGRYPSASSLAQGARSCADQQAVT
jgi:hypothetical protein